MSAGEFLDTNILVYAFTTDERSKVATTLLAKRCTIGVQGLNEFANTAKRKLGMTWAETAQALAAVRQLCAKIEPPTLDVHDKALMLASEHGFAMFDAVMVATALKARCHTFWSEDLQHGRLVEGRMTIRNPFVSG